MAKKASRKQAPARSGSRKTAKRPTASRRPKAAPAQGKGRVKRVPKKTTARKTARKAAAPKTARRKTASRAAATRSQRQKPSPKPKSRLSSAGIAVRGALAGAVAVVADRLPWTRSDKPDAIALLESDHRRFEDLLKQGEETTERAKKTRRELLDTLTRELNAHELKEEKVLYPALQQHPEAKDIVLEGYQEHHVADLIVNELHQVATDDEQWGAKFKVLKESIEHHIQEEEGEMFRTARGIFSHEELHELGARMEKLK